MVRRKVKMYLISRTLLVIFDIFVYLIKLYTLSISILTRLWNQMNKMKENSLKIVLRSSSFSAPFTVVVVSPPSVYHPFRSFSCTMLSACRIYQTSSRRFNKDPQYGRIAPPPPTFATQSPLQRHIRDVVTRHDVGKGLIWANPKSLPRAFGRQLTSR